MNPSQTALVYSSVYLTHDAGPRHPENPRRLRAILAALKKESLWRNLTRLDPKPAEVEWLKHIHDEDYIEHVRWACEKAPTELDFDTSVSKDSFRAALLAVGGVMTAIDAVMERRVRNAFCAVRPPGHHARRDRATGFCLFNNVAIGARYIQRKYGLKRVLIVDWDAHHGDGTQEAFYEDPSVFYFSTHQFPCYPGSGSADERGAGKGLGFTGNVPMAVGSGDSEYMAAFRELLLPSAERIKPNFVLVSAGFDAHKDDPLTHLGLTTAGFMRLTEVVKGIAERYCEGRLVSVLEGGYDREALSQSVVEHIKVLARETH